MAKQQYSTPGTISSTVVNMCEQHIGLFDKYVIYQTGQYEYSCYIEKMLGGVKLVTISRTNNNSLWDISVTEADSFPTSLSYPYYSYSNCGWGQVLDLTAQTNIVCAVSVMGIFLFLCLKTMFFGWCKR